MVQSMWCNLCESMCCHLCGALYVVQSLWCNLYGAVSVVQPMWCNLCGAIYVCLLVYVGRPKDPTTTAFRPSHQKGGCQATWCFPEFGPSGPKGRFGPEQSRVPEIGWADGVRVGLGWQAVCSEAVQSCRGQAGCPELQRTGWADGVGVVVAWHTLCSEATQSYRGRVLIVWADGVRACRAEDSLGRGPGDGLG